MRSTNTFLRRLNKNYKPIGRPIVTRPPAAVHVKMNKTVPKRGYRRPYIILKETLQHLARKSSEGLFIVGCLYNLLNLKILKHEITGIKYFYSLMQLYYIIVGVGGEL